MHNFSFTDLRTKMNLFMAERSSETKSRYGIKDISEEAGLPRSRVYRFMSGGSEELRIDDIIKLCEVLQVEINDFITRS